jgi:hypothetical protein
VTALFQEVAQDLSEVELADRRSTSGHPDGAGEPQKVARMPFSLIAKGQEVEIGFREVEEDLTDVAERPSEVEQGNKRST